MAKQKRKKKIKRKIEDVFSKESDGFFNILFFLVLLYIGIIGGIYSIITTLNRSTRSISADSFIVPVSGMVLIALGALFSVYLLVILFVGILELNSYYTILPKKDQKIRFVIRRWVLSSPLFLLLNIISILSLSIILLIAYFKPLIAIILMAPLITLVVIFFLKIKTDFIKNVISANIIGNPKRNIWINLYTGLFILCLMIIAFLILSLAFFHNSYFEVKLNKDHYFLGDPVYISIIPKGVLKPIPINVTYSNEMIPLNYIKDPQFGKAPIYTKIEAENLTADPYNSFIQINYKMQTLNGVYRNRLTYDVFIPVFNETLNELPVKIANG